MLQVWYNSPMPRIHHTFDQASYHKRRYNRQRKWGYELLGNACAECGSTRGLVFSPRVEGATHRVSWGSHEETLRKQLLEDTILLCATCWGRRLSRAKGGYRHGTWYSFGKMNCKCDICVSAHAERIKKRREREAVQRAQRRRVQSGRTDRAFNPAA